jgi:hypothetical protein
MSDISELLQQAAEEDERDRILAIIEETAQRYSRASVTRVALDNLALEIRERS